MEIPTSITVTLLGGLGTCVGYFISNSLSQRKEQRLREIQFRLDRYREFLLAFVEEYSEQTFESQLKFANCANMLMLIAGPGLLHAIKKLVQHFNDTTGTVEEQWKIMDEIILQMRRDLEAEGEEELGEFNFPMIVPDIKRKHSQRRNSA